MHTESTDNSEIVTSAGSVPAPARRPYVVLLDALREIDDPGEGEEEHRTIEGRFQRVKAIAARALHSAGVTNALRVRIDLEEARKAIGALRAGRQLSRLRIKDLQMQITHVAAQRDRARNEAIAAKRELLALRGYLSWETVHVGLVQQVREDGKAPDIADLNARIGEGDHLRWAASTGQIGKYTVQARAEVDRAIDPANAMDTILRAAAEDMIAESAGE